MIKINIGNEALIKSGEEKIPKFLRIKQSIESRKIPPDQIPQIIFEGLQGKTLAHKLKPGDRVAIGVGSRGIDQIASVTKEAVNWVKSLGCVPFIVPAMGSHGGGNAKNQEKILGDYGINEGFLEAPIFSSMEVVELFKTSEGKPVFFDKEALSAQAIIPISRVKIHTDFSGDIESGVLKMLVIGFGKHKGAETIHEYDINSFSEIIPRIARQMFEKIPFVTGIGLLEDGKNNLCKIGFWDQEEIESEEKKMLEEQKQIMATIPFPDIDILIVEEIGKNISGQGMDPKVVRRGKNPSGHIETIVILDLTDKTAGNASGVGLGDIITKRLFQKIDFHTTYTNLLTAQMLGSAKVPVVMPNDFQAFLVALKICKGGENKKIVRIKNTMKLEEMWISEGLLEEAIKNPRVEILGKPLEFKFDKDGNFLDVFPKHN